MIQIRLFTMLWFAAIVLAFQVDSHAAPQLISCKKAKCQSCSQEAPCVDADCHACQPTAPCQDCHSCQVKQRCGKCRMTPCRCRRTRQQAQPCCPSCGDCAVCLLELDFGKEEKTCFKVESKQICVLPVRFPWQKCCPPGKAPVKTVKVLKTHKYECESCSYKWSLQEPANDKAETTVTPAIAVPDPNQPTPVQPPPAQPLPYEK